MRFDRQPPVRLHFLLDFPVDRGLPLSACSIRCSSMRCKHPFKKSISSACWPTLRSSSAIRPSDQRSFPLPGKALPGPWRNSRRQRCNTLGLTSNARAASPMDTPCSSLRTAASLNSFVNCLRDNPMTQFSIQWNLSLNRLSQFWGQVHGDPCILEADHLHNLPEIITKPTIENLSHYFDLERPAFVKKLSVSSSSSPIGIGYER